MVMAKWIMFPMHSDHFLPVWRLLRFVLLSFFVRWVKIVLPDFYSFMFRRYAAVTTFLRPVQTRTTLAQTMILNRSCVWTWTRPRLAKTTKTNLFRYYFNQHNTLEVSVQKLNKPTWCVRAYTIALSLLIAPSCFICNFVFTSLILLGLPHQLLYKNINQSLI